MAGISRHFPFDTSSAMFHSRDNNGDEVMTCTNAAANRLHNDASTAATIAERKRNKAKEDRHNVRLAHSVGYFEGKAIALSNADEVMRAELRRLMNKFQNGSLSMEDFGIDP